MATIVRGTPDVEVGVLQTALDAYEAAHPGAEASLYRYNPGSIRMRVIDSRFDGMAKSRRHADVWDFLAARVPDDALADVSLVLTLSPAEMRSNLMNLEFDDPAPLQV